MGRATRMPTGPNHLHIFISERQCAFRSIRSDSPIRSPQVKEIELVRVGPWSCAQPPTRRIGAVVVVEMGSQIAGIVNCWQAQLCAN